MSWWVILVGVIVVGLVWESFLSGKKSKPQKKENPFHFITTANARKKQEEPGRLEPADEHLVQRVKKLFYSAAYHESRNVTAFHNILKELVQITKEILSNGGKERMARIADRVEWLCGDDRAGFAEFISIMRRSYLPAGAES
ncbi:MAG TPA: hypothetical protein VGO58_06325 [Chitinophagaceae bacterium]|jgi:hypothetical protein|nr:hypothetical protein [Chitinophagaceae bacterium]